MLGLRGSQHSEQRRRRSNRRIHVTYFSMEVAKLVTQPFCSLSACTQPGRRKGGAEDSGIQHTWPLRVPLRINCSAIEAVGVDAESSTSKDGEVSRSKRRLVVCENLRASQSHTNANPG